MLTGLLTLGSRWTLVGGKGGVGKTTSAAALAVAMADAGESVLVLSVDPAHSLGDALGVPLSPEPSPVPGVERLSALEVDAERERQRFLATHRGSLLQLIERGTYLDRDDVEGFGDLAVPGMDELAALFRLIELAEDPSLRLVIDTAPTGHTLRLLDLPRVARAWLAALQAMEDKYQTVAVALAGAYRADEATRLLRELDADLARVADMLTDPDRTRFLLVTTAEPVVLAETRRYREELVRQGIGMAGILVNRSRPGVNAAATGAGMVFLPPMEPGPEGVAGLRRFAASAAPSPAAAPHRQAGERGGEGTDLRVGGVFEPPLDRRLYLVGGKGGVGKSTAAGALSLLLARRRGGRVLLLSTDPAGSLGEVLGRDVGGQPTAVDEAPGLFAQQLDAAAAWDAFRDHYREEAERLFSGLLSGGLSATTDQQVVQRLVDLAPPGIDELMALLEVVDATADRPYDALVLDTAPTGHLLRLLQMPGVALEWAHATMRLLLKYREVVGLGSLAERVLRLSRSLRDLRERLADPAHTWFLAVALPEALSVPETARLFGGLRALGMEPGALLVNRLLEDDALPGDTEALAHARALLDVDPRVAAVAAPRRERGPAAPDELLRFIGDWRRIALADPDPAA